VDVKQIKVEIEPVPYMFSAQIVARGNSHYVRLDPNLLNFYELKAGDELLLKTIKAKRETQKEEPKDD